MAEYLDKNKEFAFKIWYGRHAKMLGMNPDPDDPRHQYDYRRAYDAGVGPEWQPEHRQYRWPDLGKRTNYKGTGRNAEDYREKD